VKNLHGDPTLNGAEIGAGLDGPFNGNTPGGGLFGHLAVGNSAIRNSVKPELPEYLVVGDAFAAIKRSTGVVEGCGRISGDLFFFDRRQGQGPRQRFGHYFEQAAHYGELFGGQHVEQRVRLPTHEIGLYQLGFHGTSSLIYSGCSQRLRPGHRLADLGTLQDSGQGPLPALADLRGGIREYVNWGSEVVGLREEAVAGLSGEGLCWRGWRSGAE
jgi:hypothetical protein